MAAHDWGNLYVDMCQRCGVPKTDVEDNVASIDCAMPEGITSLATRQAAREVRAMFETVITQMLAIDILDGDRG